jgi:hypothetical protein
MSSCFITVYEKGNKKGILWEKRKEEKKRKESPPKHQGSVPLGRSRKDANEKSTSDQIVQYPSSSGAGMLKTLWSRLPVRGAPK